MSKEITPSVSTLCPLCWRPEEVKVEGDLPCVECQGAMKRGFLLIGVDLSNSDNTETAVRTGHRWVVGIEAAKALYSDQAIEKGAALLDINEAKELGLPVQTSGYTIAQEAKKDQPKTLERVKCGVCGKEIEKDDLGGIDKIKGFMHKGCTPLTLS